MHGTLQSTRRRLVAWLLNRVLPAPAHVVGPGELSPVGIQRILVCRPNHRLGNTLMLTPLVGELEQRFPGAEIDLLGAGGAMRGVFAGFATIGELFVLDRRAARHPLATFSTLGRMRAKRYDLVIDAASGSSSGRIAARLARGRHLLHVQGTEGAPSHFAARPVHALRVALGVEEAALPPLDLRLDKAERAAGRDTLRRVLAQGASGDAPVLAIFPNATGSKCYDQAWWNRFLAALTERVGERRIVELVAADGVSRLGHAYPTYFTSDPRKLAAFINAAGTYVSADCGVMHLAAATRATTIGLFGRTDPRRYAPYGERKTGFTCEDNCPDRTAARVAMHLGAATQD